MQKYILDVLLSMCFMVDYFNFITSVFGWDSTRSCKHKIAILLPHRDAKVSVLANSLSIYSSSRDGCCVQSPPASRYVSLSNFVGAFSLKKNSWLEAGESELI